MQVDISDVSDSLDPFDGEFDEIVGAENTSRAERLAMRNRRRSAAAVSSLLLFSRVVIELSMNPHQGGVAGRAAKAAEKQARTETTESARQRNASRPKAAPQL